MGSIDIALGLWFGTPPVPIEITLYSDSAGLPGAPIETLPVSADLLLFVAAPAPISVDSVGHPFLEAGQQYWLAVQDDTEDAALLWFWAPGASGPVAEFNTAAAGWVSDGSQQGAFEIDSVPEPATFGLWLFGLATMLIVGCRRLIRPPRSLTLAARTFAQGTSATT